MKETYAIDDENNDTYWHDAIAMEMPIIINSVEEFSGDVKELDETGFSKITGHISTEKLVSTPMTIKQMQLQP